MLLIPETELPLRLEVMQYGIPRINIFKYILLEECLDYNMFISLFSTKLCRVVLLSEYVKTILTLIFLKSSTLGKGSVERKKVENFL